jgi:hypothetical protein
VAATDKHGLANVRDERNDREEGRKIDSHCCNTLLTDVD